MVSVLTGFLGDTAGLRVSLHFDVDRVVVALSGEVDGRSGPMLADLLNVTMHGSVSLVEVDMAHVEFIDIAGLRVLARAHRLGVQRGVVLTLCRLRSDLVWLLQITGTKTLLPGRTTAPGNGTDTLPAGALPPSPTTTQHPSRQGAPDETTLCGPGAAPDTRDQRAAERDRQADKRDQRADERDRQADEREQHADDMQRLDAERSRLLDERHQRVLQQQRWENIREEVANEREQELEQRERDC